jgi:hypothetical protein
MASPAAPFGGDEAPDEMSTQWTEFRLSCGTIVYVAAGDVTPEVVTTWCSGAVPWPTMCTLSLDTGARRLGAIPRHLPGPQLDAHLFASAQRDMAAWALDAIAAQAAQAACSSEPAEAEENIDDVDRLRAELARMRAWARQLEHALAAARVPLPKPMMASREAQGETPAAQAEASRPRLSYRAAP